MILREIDILQELEDYLSCSVIFADQAAPKPPYPYLTLKVIIDNISNGNHPSITNEEDGDNFKQVATMQNSISISITGYGREFESVERLVKKAHDWFHFIGKKTLKGLGMVVSSVEAIQNRDSLIVDDYERRRGFDVMLRYTSIVKRRSEKLESASLEINRIKE